MSTRATIHFQYSKADEKPAAIIYRHGDGYPDGVGADLTTFFDEIEASIEDTRFSDPCYLAAKWVVWDAARHVCSRFENLHPLDFLSVGIVMEDPCNIEYRYLVICSQGYGKVRRPIVICQKLGDDDFLGIKSIQSETTLNRKTGIKRKRSRPQLADSVF